MECYERVENVNSLRLQLSGRMTFSDHAVMKRITQYVIAERMSKVIVDLSRLSFIDSAALGMFLILHEEMKKIKGAMVVEGASGQVARIFAVGEINELISK